MKQIFLFSLLFLGNLMSAQKKYDQFYVNNKNDTIKCEIINFSNKMVNVIANGAKMSLSPKLIKSFSSYTSNGYRTFTILKNDLNNFYEVNIIGKISFYKVYTSNGYNGILPVMVKNDKIVYFVY